MPNEELVKNRPAEHESRFVIMDAQDEGWESLIEKVYGEGAKKTVRYAIKKEGTGVFDEERLRGFVGVLRSEYRIEFIGADTYAAVNS